MVRLKSRTQSAINGFQFIDAAIDQNPLKEWDFNLLVRMVIARRTLNPRFNLPTDPASVELEVDNQNALRMQSIAGAESYYINDSGGPPANFPTPRSRGWASAAGRVKRVAAGANTLLTWLGEGAIPVAKEKAQARASVCVKCPQNKPGDLTSWFTEPVAAMIKLQIESRKEMQLSTPEDDKLDVCDACACPLKLKVHVPLANIKKYLDAETMKRLDPGCWIPVETP